MDHQSNVPADTAVPSGAAPATPLEGEDPARRRKIEPRSFLDPAPPQGPNREADLDAPPSDPGVDKAARLTKAQAVIHLSRLFDRAAFGRADLAGSLAIAAEIHLSLWISAAILLIASAMGGWLAAVAVWPVCALISVRALRGLELMIHDASHGALVRDGPGALRANDLIGDLLFGLPVVQEVGPYRRTHVVHHRHYGSDQDPCLIRRAPSLLGAAGRGGLRVWLPVLLRALPRYVAEYYMEAGMRPRAVAKSLAWHAVWIAVLTMVVGPAAAFAAWGAAFLAPFVLLLPPLRAIAEAEEHDWSQVDESDYLSTYNNIGLVHRVLLHPFNDAYHLVHHLFGEVPTTRLRRLHHLLKDDPVYREGLSRRRILEP